MLKTTAFFLLFALGASADILPAFSIQVDTTSILGTTGNLDFQFNPGNFGADSAVVTIDNFSSTGTLAGPPMLIGAVTGALPGAVTIHNNPGLNDYTEGFTFGNSLLFRVSFSGPAVASPSGTSSAGSSFAFSLFNSDFSAALLTSDQDGILVREDVDTLGKITTSNFGAGGSTSVSAVPEPAGAGLAVIGLAAVGIAIRRLRAVHQAGAGL